MKDYGLKLLTGTLLAVVSFFSAQTYFSIKNLEKDVITIRLKLAEFEAPRISRAEIREIIAEYHNSHPCKNNPTQ
jgi:hypothetical protein